MQGSRKKKIRCWQKESLANSRQTIFECYRYATFYRQQCNRLISYFIRSFWDMIWMIIYRFEFPKVRKFHMVFAYVLNKNVVDHLRYTRVVYEFNDGKITFLLQHLYVINIDTVYSVEISNVSTYVFRNIPHGILLSSLPFLLVPSGMRETQRRFHKTGKWRCWLCVWLTRQFTEIPKDLGSCRCDRSAENCTAYNKERTKNKARALDGGARNWDFWSVQV